MRKTHSSFGRSLSTDALEQRAQRKVGQPQKGLGDRSRKRRLQPKGLRDGRGLPVGETPEPGLWGGSKGQGERSIDEVGGDGLRKAHRSQQES